jgi:hypothetical protein
MTNHTPPTEQQLAEIDSRTNAATPGPWGVYQYGGDSLIEIAADLEDTGCGYKARRTVARLEDEPLDNDPTHREWTAEEDWAQVQADAAFIAHAPEDVRVLLAEVRRLRARTLTESEYNSAWHAVEGAAGEEGADPGTVLHAVLDRLGIALPGAEEQQPAVEPAEACGKCKTPFDPADTRFDGHARYRDTPYCRGCVDACHDNEIADHRCVICA